MIKHWTFDDDNLFELVRNGRKCRFCDVDAAWAHIEGEGDLSLTHWRRVRINFFRKHYPDFHETDVLELNEFMVI